MKVVWITESLYRSIQISACYRKVLTPTLFYYLQFCLRGFGGELHPISSSLMQVMNEVIDQFAFVLCSSKDLLTS